MLGRIEEKNQVKKIEPKLGIYPAGTPANFRSMKSGHGFGLQNTTLHRKAPPCFKLLCDGIWKGWGKCAQSLDNYLIEVTELAHVSGVSQDLSADILHYSTPLKG